MSYDLFLKATERQPDRHDFEEFFDGRAHFSIDDTAVWYENDSTGVYFSFELSDSASDKDEFVTEEDSEKTADDEADDYWVVFNMNYARPHVFALEALPEVRAFIEHFKLSIDDPQSGGMGHGPFTDAGFLNGWNEHNAFAYRLMNAEDKPSTLAYPTEAMERNWRWNYNVVERQEKIQEDIFIPTIMYVKFRGAVKSVIVWPDGIPIFIPQVDLLIIARNELAQPPIPDDAPGETAIIEWESALPLLSSFPQEQTPVPYHRLAYERAPEQVVQFIQSLPICKDEMEGVGKDEICNAELVAPQKG